jgi:hypothetical protein
VSSLRDPDSFIGIFISYGSVAPRLSATLREILMHAFRLIILVAIAAAGCSPSPGARPTTSIGALDPARVLTIAHEAVRTNDTWLDRAEFETPKRQADGSWTILVWRRPATPGGHRFITIDATGKVTNYRRGR